MTTPKAAPATVQSPPPATATASPRSLPCRQNCRRSGTADVRQKGLDTCLLPHQYNPSCSRWPDAAAPPTISANGHHLATAPTSACETPSPSLCSCRLAHSEIFPPPPPGPA